MSKWDVHVYDIRRGQETIVQVSAEDEEAAHAAALVRAIGFSVVSATRLDE